MNESRKTLLSRAAFNRKNPTPSEAKIWNRVRNRRLGGWKIRRQHVLEPYIVDFFCYPLKLAIEIDGVNHDAESDAERDAYLWRRYGVTVLRFSEWDAWSNTYEVLSAILEFAADAGP